MKAILLSIFIFFSYESVGQGFNTNEARVFFAPGNSFLQENENGLPPASTTAKSNFVAGLGYRKHIDKFAIGIDIGFSKTKEKATKANVEGLNTNELFRLFIVPAGEFNYYRNRLLRVFGAAGAGMEMLKTVSAHQKTEAGKLSLGFAYQIDPVGLSVGNAHIGGFVSLGYGYKGIASAGVSVGF